MKDLRVRVDVEPLSDGRVAKIRQQVLAGVEAEERGRTTVQMERARRRPSAAALLSFVAAAVIAALVTRAWMGRMTPADVRLATTESASQFTIGESSLEVLPRSALLVRGDDQHGIDVVLDHGAVTCEVAPRRGRPAFIVDAGEVRVRVVGTRFTVTRAGEGARVSVDHGTVELTSRGATTLLRDGESWPGDVETAAAPTLSLPAPATPPPPAPGVRPSHSHAPRHAVAPARDPKPAAEVTEASPPPPTPSAATPVTTAPVAPSPRELFEAAAGLEASSPERAAELYQRLAAGASAWAPNALYAVARLDVDRGKRAEAKGLLRDYLARYPHGQNAQDARDLLDRLP